MDYGFDRPAIGVVEADVRPSADRVGFNFRYRGYSAIEVSKAEQEYVSVRKEAHSKQPAEPDFRVEHRFTQMCFNSRMFVETAGQKISAGRSQPLQFLSPASLARAATSSPGSTGFGRCKENPAARARMRSSALV